MRRLVSPRVQALRQIDDWPVEFAAAGVVDPAGVVSTHGDATPRRSARLGVEAGGRAGGARRRRGGRRRPRRAGRSSRCDGETSARAHVGPAVRGSGADRAPGSSPDLLERGVPRARRPSSQQRAEMPFAEYVREAVCAPLELALDPTGDPGSGHARVARRRARDRARAPRAATSSRRRHATRWSTSSSPGSPASCPTTAASIRSTGVSACSSTRGRRRGWERATSPRTYGHFGGSGTFLWVDPEARVVCAALTTREFGDWAKEAWPRFADAVLDELG